MAKDAKRFCEALQIMLEVPAESTNFVMDRVPITPIPIEEDPFRRMTMDVVGPIEPTSAAGHKYCLCIVHMAYNPTFEIIDCKSRL